MKKKPLLLIAVVALALLLAGCGQLPISIGTINVQYELEAGMFVAPSYAKKLQKNKPFEGAFWFVEGERGREAEEFQIKVSDGGRDGREVKAYELGNREGIFLYIPDVGSKDITISIKLK
ncbi:MAG: hypothetical protein GX199_02980 [Firmicutes bacterium]|nr:hypothetical protein [Bacillota bacterium]